MYTKQEAAQLKQEFWTAFGQYMSPVMSAEGEKIAWVNYKTGEKNITFRLQAVSKKATITIEINHKDADIQQLYYEQFVQLKKGFEEIVGKDWKWQLHNFDEYGKTVSRIFCEKPDSSIYKKEDWPALISFFKTNIIALDLFWSEVKYGFESLR